MTIKIGVILFLYRNLFLPAWTGSYIFRHLMPIWACRFFNHYILLYAGINLNWTKLDEREVGVRFVYDYRPNWTTIHQKIINIPDCYFNCRSSQQVFPHHGHVLSLTDLFTVSDRILIGGQTQLKLQWMYGNFAKHFYGECFCEVQWWESNYNDWMKFVKYFIQTLVNKFMQIRVKFEASWDF